jgi:hypothetical protein
VQLPPGKYRVETVRAGFRKFTQEVSVEVGGRAALDIVLTVGEVTETVNVTGETSLVEAASGAVGTLVDNTRIMNLPLNGRNAFELVALSPGIIPMGGFGQTDPWDKRSQAAFSASGSKGLSSDLLIDGASTTSTDYNTPAFSPSLDSIQEFKVQLNSYSAEFGRSQGAILNAVTKSGTNRFHGSAYDYLRNDNLDANSFFNNAADRKKADLRWNQFGGTLGGPLLIPRVYDGHDRTFFFASYEGMRYARGVSATQRVPTELERAGDFSRTVAASGAMIPIYNPFSTRPDPTRPNRYLRDAFPGNRIPQSMLNPVSLRVTSYYPAPNQTPLFPSGPNFFFNGNMNDRSDQTIVKVDHSFNERHRTSFRFNYIDDSRVQPSTFGNVASPVNGPNTEASRGALLEHTWMLRSNLLANMKLSYLRFSNDLIAFSAGFPFGQKLGLPQWLEDVADVKTFPTFDIAGMPIGASGPPLVINRPSMWNPVVSVSWVRGAHSIKTGYEHRAFLRNNRNYTMAAPPAGTYTFNQATTGGPDPDAPGSAGSAYGSFLIGVPAAGNFAMNPALAMKGAYTAAYLQDDWRVNSRLTLNLGLRWDYEGAVTERYDRVTWLDFDSPNPAAQAVNQKYAEIRRQFQARSPAVAAVLPETLTLRGGVQYAGKGQRRQAVSDLNNFGPRFGFAYSPVRQWALRGGYGIFFTPQTGGPSNDVVAGYQTNTAITGLGADRRPQVSLSDPFPAGLVAPTGTSLGLLTNIGAGLTSWNRGNLVGYAQQWNLNIQRGLWRQTVIEIGYVGSHGVKLMGQDIEWNLPSRAVVDLGPGVLNAVIDNPFLGVASPTTTLGRQPTTTVRQLLLPYPQFTAFTSRNEHLYNSNYHAMTLRFEQRMYRGLTYLISYTAGKSIDNGSGWTAGWQGPLGQTGIDVSNRRLDRAISTYDRSQRLVVTSTYQIPFGAGRVFGANSRLWRTLGGWQVNGIFTWMTGAPIGLNRNAYIIGDVHSPDNGQGRHGLSAANPWMNPAAFRSLVTGEVSNIPRTLPDLRSPGTSNVDCSLFKIFRIKEQVRVQLRGEFFNALNHTQFATPNTAPLSPTFGLITATRQRPREVQIGLRLQF